jgi:hypothetical protein
MQAQNSTNIIAEIDAHMQKSGMANSSWYVGITSDVESRLFGFHQVPRKGHWFIYRRAINADEARGIEDAYHRAGCKGSGGGGDQTAVYVYAYVITSNTMQ